MQNLYVRVLNKIVKWREKEYKKGYVLKIKKYPTTVLCFHDVKDVIDSVYTITTQEFTRLISEVASKTVSINCGSKEFGNTLRYILTFDDGYESIYHTVFPICKKYDVPFTVYIATDFIDKPGYLSQEQIAQLAAEDICTIGSHMCSHRKTREMRLKEVWIEWYTSKKLLETITQKRIIHAALPYGSVVACSLSSVALCFCLGYKTIATTLDIPVKSSRVLHRRVYQNNKNLFLLM